jgi:hypothetical protein
VNFVADEARSRDGLYDAATVVNNHYDTDGCAARARR